MYLQIGIDNDTVTIRTRGWDNGDLLDCLHASFRKNWSINYCY